MTLEGNRYTLSGLAGLLLTTALLLCACADSELDATDAAADDSNGLFINFSIADFTVNSSTRATSSEDMKAYSEPWSESPWYETTINRLDLFVFRPTTTTDSDGNSTTAYNLVYHFYNASPSSSSTWKLTYTNDYDETTNYASSCIQNTDSLYLIANYNFTVRDQNLAENITGDNISTLKTLKNMTAGYGTDETPHGARSGFYYSAHLIGSDYTGSSIKRTYTFSLQRFMAKACIRIYYREYNGTTYTQLTDFSSKDITLQAMQYTVAGPVTDDGVAPISYTKTNEKTVSDTTTIDGTKYTTHTTYSYTYTCNINVTSEESAPSSETYYPTASSSSTSSDDSSDDSSDTSTDTSTCAVFYFYPNDWLDMNKVSNIHKEQPILEGRRTYIQMNIQFTNSKSSTVTYTYEIPLNYLLPTDSDAYKYTYPEELSDDDLTTLQNLYRINANHVYNVNVYIAEQETGFIVYASTDDIDFINDLTSDSNYIVLDESNITVETDSDNPIEDLTEDDDSITSIIGSEDDDSTTK